MTAKELALFENVFGVGEPAGSQHNYGSTVRIRAAHFHYSKAVDPLPQTVFLCVYFGLDKVGRNYVGGCA
jgi:hypothetical protein